MSKSSKKVVTRPNREPDHYSKRNVPYWWSPEWVRGTSADVDITPLNGAPVPSGAMPLGNGRYKTYGPNYGRIHPVKVNQHAVELHMKSKDGKLTYIQGSIQKEFQKWHEDRQIDYILLGMNPDEILASDD